MSYAPRPWVIASDVAVGNLIQQGPIVNLRDTKCDPGYRGPAGLRCGATKFHRKSWPIIDPGQWNRDQNARSFQPLPEPAPSPASSTCDLPKTRTTRPDR